MVTLEYSEGSQKEVITRESTKIKNSKFRIKSRYRHTHTSTPVWTRSFVGNSEHLPLSEFLGYDTTGLFAGILLLVRLVLRLCYNILMQLNNANRKLISETLL